MFCGDVMRSDVECCWAGESVTRAAERMRRRNLGFLPVCNERGQAIGAVTDRDLVVRVLADGRSSRIPVGDVMTKGVVTCSQNDALGIAEERMMRYRVERVVVVDGWWRPVGIISLADLAQRELPHRTGEILSATRAREVPPKRRGWASFDDEDAR